MTCSSFIWSWHLFLISTMPDCGLWLFTCITFQSVHMLMFGHVTIASSILFDFNQPPTLLQIPFDRPFVHSPSPTTLIGLVQALTFSFQLSAKASSVFNFLVWLSLFVLINIHNKYFFLESLSSSFMSSVYSFSHYKNTQK